MAPDGQHTVRTLLLVTNHRHSHIACLLWLHQHKEGVLGAVGIPQREDSIVAKTICLMDILVQAAILTIDVHINRGVNHCMVVRSVNHSLLVLRTLHLDRCELVVPSL